MPTVQRSHASPSHPGLCCRANLNSIWFSITKPPAVSIGIARNNLAFLIARAVVCLPAGADNRALHAPCAALRQGRCRSEFRKPRCRHEHGAERYRQDHGIRGHAILRQHEMNPSRLVPLRQITLRLDELTKPQTHS